MDDPYTEIQLQTELKANSEAKCAISVFQVKVFNSGYESVYFP